MKQGSNGLEHRPSAQRHWLSLIVVIVNVTLLVLAVLLYNRYTAVYQEQLHEENLGNIANLNQSAAINATSLVSSWSIKLEDIARYTERHTMTCDELLAMLDDTNSSMDRQFELIGGDYTGYLARRDDSGGFVPVSYASKAYPELQRVFNDTDDTAYKDICFAPEFTDSSTALKHFAIYRHVRLRGESGAMEPYTILLAARSSMILDVFNRQDGFDGQSSVLIDATGNYIVSSSDFKSTNFFKFLYVYNDLSLDQRNAIENELHEQGSGELFYKNAAGLDCVFRYERMSTNDWYCITSVPIRAFRTPEFNIRYAVYAALALVLMLALDIFWLQQLNRRLRFSIQREKEAGEAKTDFLSRMSHDIRTPLNGIIGLTTLAKEENNPPRTQEYLDNIHVSGQFLAGLVNDILDLSKVESGTVALKPEPYSSKDLCKYIEAVVTPLCRNKGLAFQLSPPDDGSPVLLDRLRFNQVMFNLLSNAVKYTPPGGLIELYWVRKDLENGRVSLDFIVRDNGIGISEDFQKHMFETFTQERIQNASTGAGLGLAIVQTLVGLMNGHISVKSKVGEGTTFTVHLDTTACAEQTESEHWTNVGRLEGRRVLLCEDNAINVIVAQRLLEKWGMCVEPAADGKEGLEKFAASVPGYYDAVLMDIMMPEMNGLEATRAIRVLERPDAATVPIIAMTANAYDSDVKNCLDAGMNAHMGKPLEPNQLHDLLAQQLA